MAAYWNAEKGEVILCDSVDISIAVATEKVIDGCLTVIVVYKALKPFVWLQGLMTPIIKNADHKTISAISSEVILSH